MAVAPDVITRSSEREQAVILPPYAVILHNDDVNEMLYVVRSLLICVPELSAEDAAAIMLEAHQNGKARVIVCPLERAELYRDRLQSRGLTATVERA
jgi:ATP-dependent Clp protease adaptor protein ClpS